MIKKKLLKGSQHFTSLRAKTFQSLRALKLTVRQTLFRNAYIWIKFSVRPSASFVGTFVLWCLQCWQSKHTSPTNKKWRPLWGFSLHYITINPLSVSKAAFLNYSNKTPPTVKLLQYTWTHLTGSDPCLFSKVDYVLYNSLHSIVLCVCALFFISWRFNHEVSLVWLSLSRLCRRPWLTLIK